MKKLYFSFFILFFSLSLSAQDILISGVIDGPLPGGLPKGIELYVINDIPDLSIYGLERAGNGDPSTGAPTYTFPADSYSAGDFIYVGTTNTSTPAAFMQYLGVTVTYQDDAVNHNGDDTIIFYKNGAVEDYFGEVGVDGTGTPWESLDGWAYRNNSSGPNTTFTVSEWTFSGPNALDGCDLSDDSGTNAGCGSVFPLASYAPATASVDDDKIAGFTVYPNPVVNGDLFIKTLNNADKNIEIYDVLGKKVYDRKVSSSYINISNLKSGVYILKVIENNKSAVRKLVIK